jgi:hypothetical protein
VAFDEGLERGLVATGGEALQQLGIVAIGADSTHQDLSELSKSRSALSASHRSRPLNPNE